MKKSHSRITFCFFSASLIYFLDKIILKHSRIPKFLNNHDSRTDEPVDSNKMIIFMDQRIERGIFSSNIRREGKFNLIHFNSYISIHLTLCENFRKLRVKREKYVRGGKSKCVFSPPENSI